jgi:hypothetical protein
MRARQGGGAKVFMKWGLHKSHYYKLIYVLQIERAFLSPSTMIK